MSMFFGAGGLYFNKPLAKYNILNDADNDVFNLWDCVENRNDEIIYLFINIVIKNFETIQK